MKVLHQRAAIVVIVRHVGADQNDFAHPLPHCFVAQNIAIDDLAFNTPVRRKIEQHGFAGGARGRHGGIECCQRIYGLDIDPGRSLVMGPE